MKGDLFTRIAIVIDESDIMILADLGYDAMEIEELMYDPVMLREIVSECREMMACELRG